MSCLFLFNTISKLNGLLVLNAWLTFNCNAVCRVYAAHLPSPLASNSRLTLSITYSLSHSLQPLPRTIEQDDPQFLSFAFPKYIPSLYPTTTQRTTIKIPQGSKLASYSPAQIRGSTLSYGPYDDVSATTTSSSSSEGEGEENVEAETYSLRYENTTPLPHTPLLRRTLTISHTSDSIAHEDAYIDFTNRAANLSHSFSRVAWTVQAWHGLTTTAIKELKILTGKGVSDAWFVDDVGNVSTSHFRRVDGVFEVKPRYPVFGGWRYSFRVGWETALHGFLKKVGGGDEGKGTGEYLLKVPLMEVPANKEGMTIDSLDLRISLPEGSDVLSWELSPSTPKTVIPARSSVVVSQEKDKTFLDTIGRTVLRLQLHNLSDESDGVDVIVRYRLSWFDEVVRKPGVVAVAVVAVVVAWGCVRRVDVGIRRR